MSFDRAILGRTGIEAGRLGLAPSYGAPCRRCGTRPSTTGVNYFYWGSIRRGGFGDGLRALAPRIATAFFWSHSRIRAWRRWSAPAWSARLRCPALRLYRRIAAGFVERRTAAPHPGGLPQAARARPGALSGRSPTHNRPADRAQLAGDPQFDIFHVRYNAVHRGAEREVFGQFASAQIRPGLVSFTATSWRQLLRPQTHPARREDAHRGRLLPLRPDSQPAVDVCMTGPVQPRPVRAKPSKPCSAAPCPRMNWQWMRRVGDAIYGKVRKGQAA
jgi:hypothetical protein